MALSPNGLANEIVNSIKGKITNKNVVAQMMPELGHAIARYLTKNTSVMYAWSGIQPGSPPVPDPVVSYTTKQVVGDFTCSPTMTSDPVAHGIILGKQITDGIRTFKIMPALGWTVPPGGFLCAPPIILPPCPQKGMYQHWLFQSNIILTFYRAWIKPDPLTGTHGAFLAPPGGGAVMSMIF
jgi:hypothetical protein